MSKIIRCLVDRKRFYRRLTQIPLSTSVLVIAQDGAATRTVTPPAHNKTILTTAAKPDGRLRSAALFSAFAQCEQADAAFASGGRQVR